MSGTADRLMMDHDPANHHQTQTDGHLPSKMLCESPGSKKLAFWTVGICILLIVVGSAFSLGVYFGVVFPPNNYAAQDLCTISAFSAASLFAPDLTFGNFTITEAKAIDISWNLGVGRVGQAVAGWISYRVVRGAVMRIVERVPVKLELFETLSLHPFSFSAIIPLYRAIIRTADWRARTTLSFLLLSAIFILAFPTLSDLETGYLQQNEVFRQDLNGTQTRIESIKGLTCMDSEPSRCNTTDGEAITLICVPRANRYQWGFSSIWLTITLSIMALWIVGMYGVWVDAGRHSIQQRKGRKLGRWRAIVDLGDVIRTELGPNTGNYSNEELEKSLDSAKPVMYGMRRDTVHGINQVVLTSEANTSTSLYAMRANY